MADIPLGKARGEWKVSAIGPLNRRRFEIHRTVASRQEAIAIARKLNRYERIARGAIP